MCKNNIADDKRRQQPAVRDNRLVSSYKQVGVERRKKKQKIDWRRQSD